jgi:hypothetical protein
MIRLTTAPAPDRVPGPRAGRRPQVRTAWWAAARAPGRRAGPRPRVRAPRLWAAAAFAVSAGFAGGVALFSGNGLHRWWGVAAACVPILALLCLGFALLWHRPRPALAGVALGLAAAAKATAWPAVIVAAVLVGNRAGGRPTLAFLGSAAAACAAIVAPVAVAWPSALAENTIAFPLGLAGVPSAAASPLPGHVIAGTGHAGHLIAIALLLAAGALVAASLAVRPPPTVPSAVWRLAAGLSVMLLLAPATRFGYFIYPACLLLWLTVSQLGRRTPASPFRPTGAGPDIRPRSHQDQHRGRRASGGCPARLMGPAGHPAVAGGKE